MRILKAGIDFEEFFEQVHKAKQRVLLLDYDGTLAPFHIERDKATPYPGVREVLTAILDAGHTRVVIVSGRMVDEVIPLLGLSPLEIWGSHGWEHRLADGSYHLGEIGERAARALGMADKWAQGAGPPTSWERKPVSRAFHWRGMPAETARSLRARILEEWESLVESGGLETHEFDGGLELRVPGRDKGVAVRTVLAEATPEVSVAYLGDDLTDEDAFMALQGQGLSVLVRENFRPTAADLWLIPPYELLEFLHHWAKMVRTK